MSENFILRTSTSENFVFNIGKSEISLAIIGSILIRWCVSLGSYSGQGKPPMYGDYEAQRHWQEVTINLPVAEWYTNSSKNDLKYWGLDYPPLTAYHSWLCGFIASKVNPDWVALNSSRGIESYHHKLFMRYTVLTVDLLILFPAFVSLWCCSSYTKSEHRKNYYFISLLLLLFYPGLILIDHGHFQYNNFSLGLLTWALIAFIQEQYIIGSIFYCLALNYKQMELYHALPIFFFLLGKAFSGNSFDCVKMIVKLAATVLCCFAIIWLPYLHSIEAIGQVLSRLFPVGRGLYEDKVANFWCTVSPLIKLKSIMDHQKLIQLSAITTLLFSLPSCLHLLHKPTIRNLKFSLVNVSLVFFLFSYQVHEKSILIPAISACFLFGELPTLLITWFLHLSVLSMSPLLLKDGLVMQQAATSVLFLALALVFDFEARRENEFAEFLSIGFWTSVIASAFLVVLPFLADPPVKYPDLWAVAVSSISCAAFLAFSFAFHYFQFANREQKAVTIFEKPKSE